jgi:sulfur carrier protein
MEISINDQLRKIETPGSLSVQKLLDIEIPLKQKGIAVALNNAVVPRKEWETCILSPNDKVLIIKATQGG